VPSLKDPSPRAAGSKPGTASTEAPAVRGRGRPKGTQPAKTGAERQAAIAERRKQDGLQTLKLHVLPELIDAFDALRAPGESREDVFEGLVVRAGNHNR